MGTVEQRIDVDVPVSTAYDQWTQFEEFPRFMEGVEEIRQTDDSHLHWRTKIAGVVREFDAEITEQRPGERVAWRSTGGSRNAGAVTFHRLGDARTRVTVQIDEEPDNVLDKVGDALGILDRRVKGDLERFKAMIEERGTQSGAGARAGRTAPPDADLGPDGTEAATGSPGPTPVRQQGGL